MTVNLNEQLINDILSLPDAPIFVNTLNKKLEEERKRRTEFYKQISEKDKAEFINGEIVMHSPVKKEHNDVLILISRLIGAYVDKHHLGYVGVEKIMIALTRNDYEPDLCYFNQAKAKHFKKGQVLFPAPDLIIEILSEATSKNDRTVKFTDYEGHQVSEYWIIDPQVEIVEQYRLNEVGKYELIMKAPSGEINCTVIENFKIPISAMFSKSENQTTLKDILVLPRT